MGEPTEPKLLTELLAAARERVAARSDPAASLRVHTVLDEAGLDLPRTLTVQFGGEHPMGSGSVSTFIDAHEPARLRSLAAGVMRGETGSANEPANTAGRFILGHELGRGGAGQVLAARDPDLRRHVAVKLLLEEHGINADRLARFVGEAQITSQLQHPNIVPVHEMGITAEGRVYFVMKRVGGEPLSSVIAAVRSDTTGARERWTRRRLLSVFIQICQAVAYAHERGVLHRDLKPSNVMLGEFGEVLVMDWGLARLIGAEDEPITETSASTIERAFLHQTLDGATLGTPGYMSPEQIRGALGDLDARSDIWSLGAILYEMLTWSRAYPSGHPQTVIDATLRGAPTPPAERSPHRGIPEEIGAIAMRAMAETRTDRFPHVKALIAAVESFLEGSAKRHRAASRLAVANEHWSRYRSMDAEEERLRTRERELRQQVQGWAPLDDPKKAELHDVQERLERLGTEQATHFGKAIGAAERALSQDPASVPAREFLARAYWRRYEEAEARADAREQAYYADRVTEYDHGPRIELLRGTGALTLHTDPPGAEVMCQRYEQRGLVWPLVEPRLLGTSPLVDLPLEKGSYLLTIRFPGKRDTKYPVLITRGHHWRSGDRPIPLFTDQEIGEDFLYVPAGPFVAGNDPGTGSQLDLPDSWQPGFAISRYAVTCAEYCRFLAALHARDPAEAQARLPRQESSGSRAPLWRTEGWDFAPPIVDEDGDTWLPNWPVCAVDWDDAVAYAAWAGVELCPEAAWEKAARGVDGRFFPWGDRFDPQLCTMRGTHRTRPLPAPVGDRRSDVSPYGVRDMAGTIRTWCAESDFDGDTARRVMRGGAWSTTARTCRAANRFGTEAVRTNSYLGLRTLKPMERP